MGNNNITYDDIGNPIYYYVDCDYTDNCLLFLEWEGRQLVGVEEYTNGDFYYTYEYNDEGIRTSKTINDTEYKYTLNGSQIVSQEWDNKLIIFFYDESGSPIGYAYRTTSMTANTFYYYVFEKNLQGDIVAIYNTSGTKLVSYTYDAWGNVTTTNHNISGTNAGAQYNPFRYRGYYYDEEIGLYYLNSRYYDPSTGRFLNADGALYHNILGYNLFAYCYNNPVNYVDYTGQTGEGVLGAGYLSFLTVALVEPTCLDEILFVVALVAGSLIVKYSVEELRDSIGISIAEDEGNSDTNDPNGKTKPDKDARLKGEPGDVNVEGDKTTHIGEDGRADAERHWTDHGKPHKHTNPHDHDITWDSNGNPNFGPPQNYWDGNVPIFP